MRASECQNPASGESTIPHSVRSLCWHSALARDSGAGP
jgi:hypothetical protein